MRKIVFGLALSLCFTAASALTASADPFETWALCHETCRYQQTSDEQLVECADRCWESLRSSVSDKQNACLEACEDKLAPRVLACFDIQDDERQDACMESAGQSMGMCILTCR
ncbi:MAG: hypothetical protein ACOCVM_07325 [Desulfovibrionaceae bacterium]